MMPIWNQRGMPIASLRILFFELKIQTPARLPRRYGAGAVNQLRKIPDRLAIKKVIKIDFRSCNTADTFSVVNICISFWKLWSEEGGCGSFSTRKFYHRNWAVRPKFVLR